MKKTKTMIDRIFKNWKTTLVGLGIILAGLALVWFQKATLTEFTAFLVGGVGVMFMRDGRKNTES